MFHVNNLDVRQSRQANDNGSIVKRAKDFAIVAKEKRSKWPNKNPAIIEKERVNKLLSA